MSASMAGKVIAAPGGACGLAICRLFGSEGASVALIDMNGAEASRAGVMVPFRYFDCRQGIEPRTY